MEIYQPSDDSYFFAEFLKTYLRKSKNKFKTFLDVGCGSGILAKAASKHFVKKNILCVDINPSAVIATKLIGFRAIKSNLFSKISKEQKFDLITFNAPYLPETEHEPACSKLITTGGKNGDEVSLKFLNQAKDYLSEKGKILLLVSSLTPMEKIKEFRPKIVAKRKLFFEELRILEITIF